MKKMKFLAAALILASATTVVAGLSTHNFKTAALSSKITGDYVEARTASVFCGPCHYNGEAVTVGKDGVMAWKIDGGAYNGVNLAGLKVMADVTDTDNFNEPTGTRRAELTFDTAATDKQIAAFTSLLSTRLRAQLGDIVAVHKASISFTKRTNGYDVTAAGFAALAVDYRADNSCCVMPSLVWYEPFSPIEHRMVGYTENASYSGKMTDPWYRSEEDSAFYGSIAF
jgi:hypothetical protein